MMKVIGIDPSLTRTAIASTDEVKCFPSKPCKRFHHEGNNIHNRMARIETLVSAVEEYLAPMANELVAIYIEGYSYASQHGSEFLAEYGGVLRWHLTSLREGLPVYEISPATLKQFVTGKGNSKKEIVCAWLSRRYNVEFHNNDEYDAFGLLQLGLCCEGIVTPETNYQIKAVQKILEGRLEVPPPPPF